MDHGSYRQQLKESQRLAQYHINEIQVQISREGKSKLEEEFPEFGKNNGSSTGWGVTPSWNYHFESPIGKERVIEITEKLFDLKAGYWQFITSEANKKDDAERSEALVKGRI